MTDFVWQTLLPGVHDTQLPDDAAARNDLQDLLSSREVALPAFLDRDPPIGAEIAGKTFSLSYNLIGAVAVSLAFSPTSIDLTVTRRDGGTEMLPGGRRQWLAGSTQMWPYEEMTRARLMSRAGWTDERTLEIHQQCIETPFSRNWRFEFGSDGKITVSVGLDNGFWVEQTEVLEGSAEDHPSPMRIG